MIAKVNDFYKPKVGMLVTLKEKYNCTNRVEWLEYDRHDVEDNGHWYGTFNNIHVKKMGDYILTKYLQRSDDEPHFALLRKVKK